MEDDPFERGSLLVGQFETLRQLLGSETPLDHLSRYVAAGLIQLHDPNAAWRKEPATERQQKFLRQRRLWREGPTRGEASTLISEAKKREKHA